jgi:hypothetical protein
MTWVAMNVSLNSLLNVIIDSKLLCYADKMFIHNC